MALSFIGAFVIVYSELKNYFMGRQELDFGGIDCEFGGCHNFVTTFFNNQV